MQNDEMTQATEPVQVEPTEVLYQQDKAVIDTQIATAKHFPRDINRAVDDATAVVTLDEETAAMCTYSLPRGGKQITGPSVHLAKILAQSWGNLRIEAKVIDVGFKTVTSQAIAYDLQNNLAIKVEVKRSIVDKYGKRYKDDMITVTGNAANAIALRNAVFAVIPRGVLEKVWRASKNKVLGNLSTDEKLAANRVKVLKEFADSFGATEAEVLAVVGKPAVNNITRDDMITLLGLRQSLIDGDTTPETAFNRKKDTDANGKTKEDRVVDSVKSGMAKGKMSAAK